MAAESSDERPVLLSTLPADRRERRLALAVVALSALVFVALAPFAKMQLPAVAAFIPVYQTALIINDLITAVLIFGQFAIVRSRALALLATGYLFTALMAAIHALTFPGLFAETGLLGAGPQTTAWLYMFWHAGFALVVIAYAFLEPKHVAEAASGEAERAPRVTVAYGVAAALAAAFALTLLATTGREALPAIMQGNRYTPAMIVVVSSVWGLSALALLALWRRRPRTVLDLWLMVVMCAWIFDIALAAVLNAGRFDLGFYAGRVYGLLAASFVLIVLLLENGALYARLFGAKKAAEQSLARHAERLRILHEIDQAVLAEKPTEAIAAAVIQPLRDLLGVPRAIVNRFDLAAGEVEWIAAAGRRRLHVGPGVRYSIRLMGDVDALRRGEPQRIDVRALPPGPEVDALLASGVEVYFAVPMLAGGELLGALSFGSDTDSFPLEQVSIAQEVATQLAIAMTQARLLENAKRHADELESRVRERTAQLEEANRDLSSFTYSVSHDLRAPLRAIDGYARMLEEDYAGRLDDEGRRLLAAVRDNSRRMGQLIDDLLTFSRLGRQALAKHPLDMQALARQVSDELARDARASIVVGPLPAAHADARLLKQVWLNLIANAVKYSGKQADARVEIGGGENGTENHYWVRDNGVGFDMRYADKLFNVFQRLHGQDQFPGTGVGLAIVQRVVSRHGGRVWAEGEPGAGACFHFSLPRGS